MYLAAQWASTGTEVLLLEADPAGGSLSHNLGIQFTPGLASFVASGLEVRGGNLIDHSQDVLFKNLHVMPATSSPTGARQIVKWLDDRAEDFRAVAEAEMAVIVDGGRVTADSGTAALTVNAAGVVVVARGDSSPTSLEHVGGLLSAGGGGNGVERCAVTVGDSVLSTEEWEERCGVTFCGAVEEFAEVKGDLVAFLNRNKRKSKKWRASLEAVAEALLPYARPAASEASRARRAVAERAEEPTPEAAGPARSHAKTAPVDVPPPNGTGAPAPAREEAAERDDEAVPAAAHHAAAPAPPTESYYGSAGGEHGWGPPSQQYFPPAPAAHHAPPPPDYGQYPPGQQPAYFEPPPAPPEPAYHDAPYPVYEPPPPQHPHQPPGYPQHPAAPQHPPPGYPPPPPAAEPPPPAAQPPPHGYPQPPHGQAPAYAPPPAPPPQPQEPQQWPYEHAAQPHPAPQPPPVHQPPQPAGHGVPPEAPAERREIAPSGSFRDWAARLYGHAPEGTSTQEHGGVS